MVFASTRADEQMSSVFIFASTSSDQICLASSELFRKYRWQAAESLFCFRKGNTVLRQGI